MIDPLVPQDLPLIASWASLFMVLFGVGGTAIGIRLLWVARGWTAPVQDAKLRALRRDVDLAYAKADGVEREQLHYRREQAEMMDSIHAEIRAVGVQVSLLREVRDTLREQVDRTDKLEQDLTSLACFEHSQHAAMTLPGFCPLRQVPCPLDEPPLKQTKE